MSALKKLLEFINKLEKHNIHYSIGHHRDEFIMLKIAIPGERWEIEFGENGEIEIERFKSIGGVSTDYKLLEQIFKNN
jgi:hypothetical protein